MTPNGTFIVNGTERVIVSQLHRSPGVFFETPTTAPTSSARSFLPRLVVEFEYDQKNTLYVRIDRKRKFSNHLPARSGLRSDEEILKTFYTVDRLHIATANCSGNSSGCHEGHAPPGRKAAHAILHGKEEIAHSGRKITPTLSRLCAPPPSARWKLKPRSSTAHSPRPTWSIPPRAK